MWKPTFFLRRFSCSQSLFCLPQQLGFYLDRFLSEPILSCEHVFKQTFFQNQPHSRSAFPPCLRVWVLPPRSSHRSPAASGSGSRGGSLGGRSWPSSWSWLLQCLNSNEWNKNNRHWTGTLLNNPWQWTSLRRKTFILCLFLHQILARVTADTQPLEAHSMGWEFVQDNRQAKSQKPWIIWKVYLPGRW